MVMRAASVRVGIVSCGGGNLDSVARAIEVCGGVPDIIDDPAELDTVAAIVLPGVGAFAHAMGALHQSGMAAALRSEVLGNRVPVLGICLGMQLMATRGSEGGEPTKGLGWIDGEVVLLGNEQRVPHMGWNEVHPTRGRAGDAVFCGLDPGHDFYFVHSYHVEVRDPSCCAAVTPYGRDLCCAIARDHIWGVQFHPEKSHKAGFTVLSNFLEAAC